MKAKNLRNCVLAVFLLFLTAGSGGEGGCDCDDCDTTNADIPSGGRVGTTYVADPPTMVAPVAVLPAQDAGRATGSSDDMPAVRQFLAIRQVGGPKPSPELMDKVVRELSEAGFTICGQPASRVVPQQAVTLVAAPIALKAVPFGTPWKEIKEVTLGPSESLGFHVAKTPGADFNLSQDCNNWERGSPRVQNLGDKLKICGLK